MKTKILLLCLLLIGISFCSEGVAQNIPGLTVCIRGNGDPTVSNLRGFWAIVYSEDRGLQKRFIKLDSGISKVVSIFRTRAPVGIQLKENPINTVFICGAKLPPNTHSVIITITSPPDFQPSCSVLTSTAQRVGPC